MGVVCPVCQFDNPNEDVQLCGNCGEDLMGGESKYQKPLRMLREIGQKVAESAGSFPKDKLESLYSHVVELLQDVLDQSQQQLEENMGNLRKELEKTKEVSDEEVDFTGFIDGFHFSQTCINEGIGMALNALMNMKSFKDIKSGQHQLELAVSRVQAGLEHLEKLSLTSAGVKMPDETTPEIPIEVIMAMNYLEKALEGLNSFMDTAKADDIRISVQKLDEASNLLGRYLKRFDEALESQAAFQYEEGQSKASEDAAEAVPLEIQPGSLDVRT